ncbi:MAG: hypothetical protein KIS78_07005 [Labilithrix sp.]|nr:hypothetical protein [Labilithrix sp.]
METRRVYSETLPYADLVRPRTIALLARYRLELVLAVRPWDEPELPRVARALRDGGVPLSVWPMLSDDDGRWASVHNAPQFCRLALSVCDALEAVMPPRDVLFDPSRRSRRPVRSRRWGAASRLRPWPRRARVGPRPLGDAGSSIAASRALGRAVAEIHARGSRRRRPWPLVAPDRPGGRGGSRPRHAGRRARSGTSA